MFVGDILGFWSRAFEPTRITVRAWEMFLKSSGNLGDY